MENKRFNFFLGALTPTGFAGYYSQLVRDNASHVVLLKGSPGCGKSTLIKRIANYLYESGEDVELIHCAQDPESLDSVICKNRKFIIADATSPHTLEPEYPIAFEQILPLYYCIDAISMQKHRKEIIELFNKYTFLTERSTRYLAAAGSLLQDTARTAQAFTNTAKIHELAKVLCKKYIPNCNNVDIIHHDKDENAETTKHTFTTKQFVQTNLQEDTRILSAITHEGLVCYEDTVLKMANNIIIVEDCFGYASKCMLYAIRQDALSKGHKIITCYCSMSPYDKIEHIIIPSLGLAFITSNAYHLTGKLKSKANNGINIRTIHSTRFCNKDGMSLRKKRLQFNNKATSQLLTQAQLLMKQTKACHDELESYYTKAADFPSLDRAYDKIVAQLSSFAK